MKNPTASGLRRGVECPASFVMQQAPESGDDAIQGTVNHDNVEAKLDARDFTGLPDCVSGLAKIASNIVTEPAYAIDVVTEQVRLIGHKIKRAYGELGPNEIALSTDAIFTINTMPDFDSRVVVADWKSRGRVDDASKNLQLAAAATAVMKWHKLDVVEVAIGYLDDGELDITRFDIFDMPLFFKEMRAMMEKIRSYESAANPPVHAGSWCRYCPAMVHCPAQAKPMAVFLGEMQPYEDRIPELSPEQVGKVHEGLKNIEAMVDKIKKAIKLRAGMERIPTPKGKYLGLVDSHRTSLDGAAAVARLNELGESTAKYSKTTHFTVLKEMNRK